MAIRSQTWCFLHTWKTLSSLFHVSLQGTMWMFSPSPEISEGPISGSVILVSNVSFSSHSYSIIPPLLPTIQNHVEGWKSIFFCPFPMLQVFKLCLSRALSDASFIKSFLSDDFSNISPDICFWRITCDQQGVLSKVFSTKLTMQSFPAIYLIDSIMLWACKSL